MRFILLSILFSSPLLAADFAPTESCVFATLTSKKGFASGLAHDHFVTHKIPDLKISSGDESYANAAFKGSFRVDELTVDDFSLAKKWQGRLKDIGLISTDYTELGDSDREDIKKTMLSDEQLDAKKFPVGKIEINRIESGSGTFRNFNYKNKVQAQLTIKDKPTNILMFANVELKPENLEFEGVAEFKISSFDIKPYSAFMGAVGNHDDMLLYTNCTAKKLGGQP